MPDNEFYAVENNHNVRQIRILSVGSLVSKPPAKEKRISIKARMPLSGTVNMGASEKIDHAYMFVAQNHQKVTLDNEFDGYCIELSVENLFGEPIVSNDCAMKSFEIFEMGKEDEPDVVMTFTIRTKYSGKKWEWLGNFVGEDVWAKFTPGEVGTAKADEEDGTLLDDGENDLDPDNELETGEGDDPELDKPEELEYDSGPKLVHSGPKELAAYHEKVVEGEVKRGRGRPRKIPSGFEHPLHQGNEF
jgi:hypothetical protein